MRIIVSGPANQGKSTLIKDFLANWPEYKESEFNYRDLIKSPDMSSKNSDTDLQWKILEGMVAELETWKKGDKIILDRGPLDNLIYTLWLHEKKKGGVDKAFVDKCIPVVKESYRNIDLIIFTPLTKHHKIPIVENGKRETDPEYIKEIDTLFKAMYQQYKAQDISPFFPTNDVPGWIEVFGERETRMRMLQMYFNETGDLYGEEESIINPKEIEKLERQFGIRKDPFAI